jgi:hypothetical protein
MVGTNRRICYSLETFNGEVGELTSDDKWEIGYVEWSLMENGAEQKRLVAEGAGDLRRKVTCFIPLQLGVRIVTSCLQVPSLL